MSSQSALEQSGLMREMFNSIAHRYDLLNTIISFGLDRFWRQAAVKVTQLKPGGSALDICCGTGKLTVALARLAGSEGRIVGLDLAERMLTVARRNIQKANLQAKIGLVQADAAKLPFPDNSFDCVTVSWGLKNLANLEKTVQEMVRVVRPGGRVVSLDMAQPQLPVFQQLYWLYLKRMVPVMGKFWVGNKAAYQYLAPVITLFSASTGVSRGLCAEWSQRNQSG